MKILFLQHPYHKKTQSNKFFRDFLEREKFKIEVYEDDMGELAQITDQYDLVVVWQVIEKIAQIPKLTKKIVVPMFDGCSNMRSEDFRNIENAIFISFSKTLHRFLILSGLKSFHLKYYPKSDSKLNQNASGIFFWERTPQYSFNSENLKSFIANLKSDITYRPHHDPTSFEDSSDFVNWDSHQEYLINLSSHKFFIAPRHSEGIGMSFLEAFAMGLVVIAHDAPTMNEYIEHEKNGILVNLNNPTQISGNLDFERIRANAIIDSRVGRQIYESKLPELSKWIKTVSFTKKSKLKLLPRGITLFRFHHFTKFRHLKYDLKRIILLKSNQFRDMINEIR